MTASGYILLDKPAGQTSFSSLSALKKAMPGAKIGHTGTLDSFATGLLVAMVGSYSRLVPWFVGLDKVYEAEIRFGLETETLDPEGKITRSGPIPSRGAVEAILPLFRGDIQQIPPDYSAIHVDGARASDLARRGRHPRLGARQIRIFSVEILSFSEDRAVLSVHCSSGTYIRALARDVAAACGTCSHVTRLRRTRVGPFAVEDAISLSMDAAAVSLRTLDPPAAASLHLGLGRLSEPHEAAFRNGAPFALGHVEVDEWGQGGSVAVFSAGQKLLGIVEKRAKNFEYKVVMPREDGES